MAVVVDETRRHRQAVGIHSARCGSIDLADFDNLAVLHRNVAAICRHPRAIDDAAMTDQQVVRHLLSFSRVIEPPAAALPLGASVVRSGKRGSCVPPDPLYRNGSMIRTPCTSRTCARSSVQSSRHPSAEAAAM